MTAVATYIEELERELSTGLATEHTHRPALKKLLEAFRPKVTAVNEAKRVACGAPDFTVLAAASSTASDLGAID